MSAPEPSPNSNRQTGPGRPPRSRKEDKKVVAERRRRVMLFLTQRLSIDEMVQALNVSSTTIDNDIKAIKNDSRKFLYSLAKGELPYYYHIALSSIARVIHEAWKIYNTTDSEDVKLKALNIAKVAECDHFQMLCDGPGVMSTSSVRDELAELRKAEEEAKSRAADLEDRIYQFRKEAEAEEEEGSSPDDGGS